MNKVVKYAKRIKSQGRDHVVMLFSTVLWLRRLNMSGKFLINYVHPRIVKASQIYFKAVKSYEHVIA